MCMLRRGLLLGLVLLLALGGVSVAQVEVPRRHPLLTGLQYWWAGPPGFAMGNTLYELLDHQNNGVLTNMGFSPTSGWVGSSRQQGWASLAFDGATTYIDTNANAGYSPTTPFSVCAWVYLTASPAPGVIVQTAIETGPYDGIWFVIRGDHIEFDIVQDESNQYAIASPAGSIGLGTWYDLCGTYDGGGSVNGLTIYINGAAVTSPTINANLGTVTTWTDRPWRMGTDRAASPADYLPGRLEHVRIFGVALSPTMVFEWYRQGLQGYPDWIRTPSRTQFLAMPVTVHGPPSSLLPFFQPPRRPR